ncbi:MAG: class I SAM-dependent methyltransferase [Hyphomicrobiales bacterium]|nr:class I SAM-dependent methyltransferase [Hyphomicrobiales bacterium]
MTETFISSGPDSHGAGLVEHSLDPLRYDHHSDDPYEVAGMLRSLMPEHARVLDVGCGTGSVTLVANKDKGNRVFAIEPDADRSGIARSRGVEVFQGFLDREFISQRGPFDVVMFADVLEHLAAPDEMLQLAMTALEKDGLVLASVPNVAHWSVRLKLLFGRFNYAETGICDATHLRWFTQRTIRDLFNNTGFEITSRGYTCGFSLPVYRSRFFKLIPRPILRKVLRSMTLFFPRLFACQFVVQARKRN